jgi:hypothetical protein
MSENLTHYRKVFKSDHLGVADLEEMTEEGKPLIFTITEVKQEWGVTVAGRKGDHNIAYFKEDMKPLVINSINSKVIKAFADGSPFVEDWSNITIELFVDSTVKMKGEVVGGVRIRNVQPKAKAKPVFTEENFPVAKEKGFSIDQIKQFYDVSEEMEIKYNDYEAKN